MRQTQLIHFEEHGMVLRRMFGLVAVLGLVAVSGATAQAKPKAAAPAAPTKIGYVNFLAAVQQVPGYAEAGAVFVKEQQAVQAQLKTIEDSAESAQTEFVARTATLPPAQADAQRKALEGKGTAWAARADSLQQGLVRRERELLAPMQQLAGAAVESVRQEGRFAIIFDSSAQTNTIIAADPTADITEKVVAKVKTARKP